MKKNSHMIQNLQQQKKIIKTMISLENIEAFKSENALSLKQSSQAEKRCKSTRFELLKSLSPSKELTKSEKVCVISTSEKIHDDLSLCKKLIPAKKQYKLSELEELQQDLPSSQDISQARVKKLQNVNKTVGSTLVVDNKIKIKNQHKNNNDKTLGCYEEINSGNENAQPPLRKDAKIFCLRELKVAIHRDFLIDAMKMSTDDFITVEYEKNGKDDDFTNTRQRRKRTFPEPSKSDLTFSTIEPYEREKFNSSKLKSTVKQKSSSRTNIFNLETQSKNLHRRRQSLSALSEKVLKGELTTNSRKSLEYPNKRRKRCLSLSEDSSKKELHKTENKKAISRNSTPANKSSSSLHVAEKEATKKKSKQAKEKSSKIEGEAEEEDDPNKLWCICRQPHNNKFMIMCDYCEDWFHGSCVGISKQKGHQMEKLQQEWICPNCEKKGRGMYMKFIRNSL